jgi:hypothetical protein
MLVEMQKFMLLKPLMQPQELAEILKFMVLQKIEIPKT